MYVTNHARFNVHIAGQRDQPGSDRHPGQLLGGADRHQQHGGQGRPRGAQPEAQQAELKTKALRRFAWSHLKYF